MVDSQQGEVETIQKVQIVKAQSKCPGGLKAMAIVNFVFAGIWTFWFIICLFAITELDLGSRWLQAAIWLRSFEMALMVVSGIGYLMQNRILGRYGGIAFASLAIFTTLMEATMVYYFNILTIIWLIYPVLTLIMLNTVFRDRFKVKAPEQQGASGTDT